MKTSFKDVDIPSWVDDTIPPEIKSYPKTVVPTDKELEELHQRMREWLKRYEEGLSQK